MIYLLCIYFMNRIRKKKLRDIGAVNNNIQSLSKHDPFAGRVGEAPPGKKRVKQVAISAERKPPSSDLH